jgi:hypothetical protein
MLHPAHVVSALVWAVALGAALTAHAQHDVQTARRRRADLAALGCAASRPASSSTETPTEATGQAALLDEQIAHVAADRAVRRLLPIVLRVSGREDAAVELESAAVTWTEPALSALGDRALAIAHELEHAQTTGLARDALRARHRATRAARLAWGATFPLRRHRAAPATRVVELFGQLVEITRSLDATATCAAVAEVLAEADRIIGAASPH